MARLIDADKFKEAISKSTCNWTEHMWKRVVCDVVDNQPTAYDVEKVVAGLKNIHFSVDIFSTLDTEIVVDYYEAIDIVRKGGING